jgi:nitroreductase
MHRSVLTAMRRTSWLGGDSMEGSAMNEIAMMTRREASRALLAGAALVVAPGLTAAQDLQLPPPATDGGKPLMQALRARRSIREYANRPLPLPLLSGLLWAAFGINRPASGDRTAPSWRHFIAIDIYAALSDGVWRYDPKAHRLLLQVPGDLRALTGTQDFVGAAPLNLVYVADQTRMGGAAPDDQRLYAFTDTGFIGQNVHLFCASEGLATVFRGSVDREKLARNMRLGASQFITFAQSVGYPIG